MLSLFLVFEQIRIVRLNATVTGEEGTTTQPTAAEGQTDNEAVSPSTTARSSEGEQVVAHVMNVTACKAPASPSPRLPADDEAANNKTTTTEVKDAAGADEPEFRNTPECTAQEYEAEVDVEGGQAYEAVVVAINTAGMRGTENSARCTLDDDTSTSGNASCHVIGMKYIGTLEEFKRKCWRLKRRRYW